MTVLMVIIISYKCNVTCEQVTIMAVKPNYVINRLQTVSHGAAKPLALKQQISFRVLVFQYFRHEKLTLPAKGKIFFDSLSRLFQLI